MKVYVVGPIHPYRGGISHSNELLCINLAKKQEVKVISFRRQFPSFLYPGRDQKERAIKKISLDVEYLIDSINPISWIETFLFVRRGKPNLLTFQWWTPFFAPAYFVISFLTKIFTRTKISIICQNVLPHEKNSLDLFLTKLVFKNVDFFITLSREDIRVLKSILPNAKAEYLVEATYDRVLGTKRIPKTEAKQKLGLGNNSILFFGFVREYKGLMYLIRAMPEVLKEIKADLLIVGEFWEDKQKYLDEIKKLRIENSVRIIDEYVPNEEVGIYFSAADVVVLPYVSSTESGIIQLSFGLDKPVITTNVGGNPDLIEHDKTGLLVPPSDTEALARAIIYYFKESKEREFEEVMKKRKDVFKWNEDKEKIFFHGM